MSDFLQRVGDGARAIAQSPVVEGLGRGLRRLGNTILARLPAGLAARIETVRSRHPGTARVMLACIGLVVLAMLWVSYDYVRVSHPGDRSLPDFRVIEDTGDRKEAFIEFLRPVVEFENRRVLERRQRLLDLLAELEDGDPLSARDEAWLAKQADLYRVKATGNLARARELATRIDIVPTSLALSQAALESAWGTSRFARQGNNLFGQWCFTPGCGIVPLRRPEQATYEVQAFDTIAGSVRTYLRNLNSHPAYQPLRDIRARARRAGREPGGLAMAAGLINYAAIGEDYVHHIRGVIRRNDLDQLEGPG